MSRRLWIVPVDPAALQPKERRRKPNDKSVGRPDRVAVISHMVLLSKKRKGKHF
jgi:hypothetical protein